MTSELQSVINSVGDLPPMPVVAVKVVQLIRDPNSTAKDLAKAISLDAAVSARVLKIANSPFYSMQREVKTLERAIVILGEKTLRSLVFASSVKALNKNFGLMEKMLWEDSMGCAIGARLAAMRFRCADPEEAFLGGLFRHMGKLVMNNLDSAKFLQMVQEAYNGEGTLGELERRYFPFSHAVIGAAVLKKWNFSENLIHVARYHGDARMFVKDEPVLNRLMATVNLSDNLCKHLGIGRRMPEPGSELSMTPGARALGLGSEQLEQVMSEFKEVFERDRDAFMD